jgi:hypothetical protein
VSIFDMSFKSVPERLCQTHIVQLIASVQRVNAGVSANEITNYVRVPLQKVPRLKCAPGAGQVEVSDLTG